jgi:GNAT superfamily N-acetyltransferase
MVAFTDDDLYARGMETLIASWEAYARGTPGASVRRIEGVAAAVFPFDPERAVYNNAVLARGLTPPERADTLAQAEETYAAMEIDRYALWVHESDIAMRHELEERGYLLDSSTRAMGMMLEECELPDPPIDLTSLDWNEHLQPFGLPSGLLNTADLSAFTQLFARLGNEAVSTALAFDHEGDCGIYNVTTLEHARRRGLSTALTRIHLHRALERGCLTASLQSTPMAERVYAAAGFRDLGRIFEYVPPYPASSTQ